VVEFIKLARIFRDHDYRIHLDLGYDIKEDKDRFFRAYQDEAELLPPWVHLDRIDGLDQVAGYDQAFVRDVVCKVVQGREPERLLRQVDAVSRSLSRQIVRKWQELGVSFVVVENGTLPENIAYTRALCAAIEEHGRANRMGRYVLWRDHDLMWSSEPGIKKYGEFPYPYAVRPTNSPFILYVALHDEARRRMLEWVPQLENLKTIHNTFTYSSAAVDQHNAAFRRHYRVPESAFLIARYTRIIPQKRIDRDIHLLVRVNALLRERAVGRVAYLFVAGDVRECPAEHASLLRLVESLGVADQVVFGGRLAPFECHGGETRGGDYSVRDLLAHADLASFLTSYDYESFGNPIGEAIAARVPYLTTRYQLYDTVYGDKGFRAPIMEISSDKDDLPSDTLVRNVVELLVDGEKRRRLVEFNYGLGQAHFAPGHTESLIHRLFLTPPARLNRVSPERSIDPMRPEARLSVVLPVYNEADNIARVLRSLYNQRDDRAELDKRTYEIIVVDNNSTDDTVETVRRFAAAHPDLAIHVLGEGEQGVACARKAGMDIADLRSRTRDRNYGRSGSFYLVSADADCRVDERWLWELHEVMEASRAAIGVCNYYYPPEHFARRPRLSDAIERTLRCRQVTFKLFGGFPDGKGFAVARDKYEAVGGIEIFYQLRDGRFLNHLSDDWDFGIKMRASGEEIVYAPASRVEINPRRVDHAHEEVITGRAYGCDGIITMRDIRVRDGIAAGDRDLTPEEATQAWEFSIKDFTPKNIILPVLLTPSFLNDSAVASFFSPALAERLARRIAELKWEMRITDFTPIHSYKTPCYRLYFEFADELFARMRVKVGEDIGYPPPLPPCLQAIRDQGDQARFRDFVRYFCEDRESGEAHNYFGNGGVF